MSLVYPNITRTWNYGGTWNVQDAFLVVTITNASASGSTNFESVGSVDRSRIVKVDRLFLILETNGQTNYFVRK